MQQGPDASTQGAWSIPGYDPRMDAYRTGREASGWDWVPVVGSLRDARDNWAHGEYVTMAANVVNAVTDLFVVKSLYKAGARAGSKLLASESGRAAAAWAGRHQAPLLWGAGASALAYTQFADVDPAEAGVERLLTSVAQGVVRRAMPMPVRAARADAKLAAAGEDLFVGGYGAPAAANRASGLNLSHTAHHAVQNAVSPTSLARGIAINLRRAGVHDATRTFRRAFNQVPGGLRGHLAADVRDLRVLLREAGYSRRVINTQLLELSRQNKLLWNKMNLANETVWGVKP